MRPHPLHSFRPSYKSLPGFNNSTLMAYRWEENSTTKVKKRTFFTLTSDG